MTQTLEHFVDSWLADTPVRPGANAYANVAGNVGLTLYKDDRFQVQLWTFPPGASVAEHTHPDVDSWLVRVSGKFRLTVNGKLVTGADAEKASWRGMRTWRAHIGAGDTHGVEVGPAGGSFLSISERLDGTPPVSVHLAWDGPPLDEKHAKELV